MTEIKGKYIVLTIICGMSGEILFGNLGGVIGLVLPTLFFIGVGIRAYYRCCKGIIKEEWGIDNH